MEKALIWLSNPDNFLLVITILTSIYGFIEKVKTQKGKNLQEKIKRVAYRESRNLLKEDLTKTEKGKELIHRIYAALPEKQRNKISEDDIKIIGSGIYHNFVKEKSE